MKKYKLTFLGRTHEVYPEIHEYSDNGNLAIQLITEEWGFPEPWSFLTVNLGIKCAENCAFIDVNNNGEEIVDFIINNELGKPTGRTRSSGFVTYPEFEFTNEFLNKGENTMETKYDEIYCDADKLGICSGNCKGCRNHSHFRPIDG